MKLYNQLSNRLEPLLVDEQALTIYVCGITPYDTTHLGHAFTYTVFDVLIRYLEFRGWQARYVQNVTDIDDDILRRAKQVGQDWRALGDYWTAVFIRDMRALNVRPPDLYPRATEVIPEIIATVQKLLEAGVAYAASGSVYFHVDAWPQFGELSRLPRERMLPIANERGNVPDDPNKRNPLDFVLWQAQAPGEPAWGSPWGPGRPGWHIECTAMATRFLGESIDIHGGGGDLEFPHHECEIAQSEAATGRQPFVHFWMHVAMLRYQGQKMSKSLGNLVMVRNLLERWSADAIRLCLAGRHYRQHWEYHEGEIEAAEHRAERLRSAVSCAGGQGPPLDGSAAEAAFVEAMDHDLDTPTALGVLEDFSEAILTASAAGQEVRAAQRTLRAKAGVFGLRLDAPGPEERVVSGWKRHLERFGGEPG